jgi:hypothetical protein
LEIKEKIGKILYKWRVRNRNTIVTRIINGRRREKERTQRESKNNAHKE